jgi:hypothetical protein
MHCPMPSATIAPGYCYDASDLTPHVEVVPFYRLRLVGPIPEEYVQAKYDAAQSLKAQ